MNVGSAELLIGVKAEVECRHFNGRKKLALFFFEEELREQGVGEGAIVKYLAKRFFIGYNVTLGLMSKKEVTVFVARQPQGRFGTARASCLEFVWGYGKVVGSLSGNTGKVVCCLEFVWRIRERGASVLLFWSMFGVCATTAPRKIRAFRGRRTSIVNCVLQSTQGQRPPATTEVPTAMGNRREEVMGPSDEEFFKEPSFESGSVDDAGRKWLQSGGGAAVEDKRAPTDSGCAVQP